MKYTFYEDPGHGWLRVPTLELRDLGIAHLITGCSYIHPSGKWVYLEEDCDFNFFVAAKLGEKPANWQAAMQVFVDRRDDCQKWMKENIIYNDRATLRGAPEIDIRNYPGFKTPAAPKGQMAMAL